ncbi:hypothetical protein FQN50_005932 [Emmonsiellopsis sp. PD_5]|nr:hypothetical protein FQN50_005932 [Emmonsiellopsis sp. PD_5]
MQHDFSKIEHGGQLIPTGAFNRPPPDLTALAASEARQMYKQTGIGALVSSMLVQYLEMQDRSESSGTENDVLYQSDYRHIGADICI